MALFTQAADEYVSAGFSCFVSFIRLLFYGHSLIDKYLLQFSDGRDYHTQCGYSYEQEFNYFYLIMNDLTEPSWADQIFICGIVLVTYLKTFILLI